MSDLPELLARAGVKLLVVDHRLFYYGKPSAAVASIAFCTRCPITQSSPTMVGRSVVVCSTQLS